MTLAEFKNEFNFKYDAASKGGPDIDDYEMSLMLTQAVRDITELAVSTYEANDDSRRLVAPLLKYHTGAITLIRTSYSGVKEYSVSLPAKLKSILREEPKHDGAVETIEVVVCSVDQVNILMNNPFKKPNARKVFKVEKNKDFITVFSSKVLTGYRITYVAEVEPIIVEALEFGLTIEGLNVKHATILPAFAHSKIIDLAVLKTMNAVRTSGIPDKK